MTENKKQACTRKLPNSEFITRALHSTAWPPQERLHGNWLKRNTGTKDGLYGGTAPIIDTVMS